ncbi:Tartrate-resistant acid phosphatase type 5 [Toxocara canis]|uniref:Tartrate-resistant acid phosphatase type 5 n=1 Tax=Toxocara canis TaxID=6265 RepID=A0A0B2ULQ5_TOXCA|nr:Tartrate-resistant acid phosphatase type 5 [Toxocara canis]
MASTNQLCLIVVSILITVECEVRTPAHRLKCTNGGVCERPDLNTLKFFLVGDTGGLPIYPYTTYGQNKVAKALSQMGEEKSSEFQISLGDNIYYTGVKNIFDQRFESSFEDVYLGDAMQKPWYMIGGNHDHFGNITAQVAYTYHSSRWTFPSLYYKISYKFSEKGISVDFIMTDTIVLCGNTRDVEDAGFFDMIFADVSADPDNPKDPKAAQTQWKWIERQLNESTADYLFVAGHYPVLSISEHGPMKCLVEKLNPLLKKYRVSAYFAGHDHTLQHLAVKDSSSEEDVFIDNETEPLMMHYIISGAASRSDRSKKHEGDVPPGSSLFRRVS